MYLLASAFLWPDWAWTPSFREFGWAPLSVGRSLGYIRLSCSSASANRYTCPREATPTQSYEPNAGKAKWIVHSSLDPSSNTHPILVRRQFIRLRLYGRVHKEFIWPFSSLVACSSQWAEGLMSRCNEKATSSSRWPAMAHLASRSPAKIFAAPCNEPDVTSVKLP